ncbi:MAG: LysR family transcriptional regulator [Methylococcales bacterium]|nr:LysR family transcriptional regulator [Methylococcales bacterium]
MDKLISMNVFTRVARLESFANAARDLGISRAMVTKHVMQLESQLDTRLFNRTTRSLSLTEAGNSYLERCIQVLQAIDDMEMAITHLQTEPRGTLKVGSPPVIGAVHIAHALAEFLLDHPELSGDMSLKTTIGDSMDEGLDIAIHLGKLNDSSLVARKLASSPLVICASPDYLKKNGIPKKPDALSNHSCLINWALPPRNLWYFSCGKTIKQIKVRGRMQSNVADPIRIAAINGLGLLMLPRYIVGNDIKKGKLQVVLAQYSPPPLDIYALYPHRKYLPTKVRLFLNFLEPWLQKKLNTL